MPHRQFRSLQKPSIPVGDTRAFVPPVRCRSFEFIARFAVVIDWGEGQAICGGLGDSEWFAMRSQNVLSGPFSAGHSHRLSVADYPTDLAAMSDNQLALISGRGEQLTHLLLTQYCPEL